MATSMLAPRNLIEAARLLRDATAAGNLRVRWSLLGPADRGFVERRGRGVAAAALVARTET